MITKNPAAALAVLLVCGFVSAAQADGLDYNFVDLNYSHEALDDNQTLGPGHSLEVNGSYGLPADFTVTGGLERVRYGFQGSSDANETVNSSQVGLGYHYPLLDRLDLTAEVDYWGSREHIAAPGSSGADLDAHGLDYGIGLRALATDRLELHGFLYEGHSNDNDTDSHGFKLGLIYDFQPWFGVGLGYRHESSVSHLVFEPDFNTTTHGAVIFARFQF